MPSNPLKPKPLQAIPFRGGCSTSVEPTLLSSGHYSVLRNLRGRHPGLEQRAGQIPLHTTPDGTNRVLSLYNFSKGRVVEQHLFAQMSSGNVLEATAIPPTVTTGAFGSSVFGGSTSQGPASWTTLNDTLLYTNGADPPQIYPGTLSKVLKCVFYFSDIALPPFPSIGEDHTAEVTDDDSSTSKSLSGFGSHATDCICVCTPVVPTSLYFSLSGGNAASSVIGINYWNGSTWVAVSGPGNDFTRPGAATMAQSGLVNWAMPTGAQPRYLYGTYGYWLQLTFSATLNGGALNALSYGAGWGAVTNLWDGVPLDSLEAQVSIYAPSSTRVYGGDAIILAGLTTNDFVTFAFSSPVEAIYFDVGSIPNTTASTTINYLQYWTGLTWVSVGTYVDGTNGLSNSGWIFFPRHTDTQPQAYNSSVYAYWYRFSVSKTLSANLSIGVQGVPYFAMSDFGNGKCCQAWKNHMVYSFDRYGDYLYITPKNQPQVLNGIDYGIIRVGDGRGNKVAAMRPFYNELLVIQEEVGEEGGGITLVQGDSPTDYATLVISSYLGAMNNNCVEVVDDINTSQSTDVSVKKVAYALSREGVYCFDGKTATFIDDAIRNYFDSTRPECISRGYVALMWLRWDSNYGVLRLGLVSGATATVPNVFPVYDPVDKAWSFDTLGQPLACAAECAAASGTASVVQIGGGAADGTVYLLNTGKDDGAIAVNSGVTIELDARGEVINLGEILLRLKAMLGTLTLRVYSTNLPQISTTLSMSLGDDVTAYVLLEDGTTLITIDGVQLIIQRGQTSKRHRVHLNIVADHISMELSHNVVGEGLYLLDWGVRIVPYEGQ